MSESRNFAAPLGSISSGRLEFRRGAADVTMRVDPSMPELFRAHFEGPAPKVRIEGGTVSIEHNRGFHLLQWTRQSAQITLNGSIPWQLEIRGGVSRLRGDLTGLQLESLVVRGGASQLSLKLPKPYGTVPIRVGGGVSGLELRRPDGVAARVEVAGGASKLALDEQTFGSIGGPVRLQTPDFGFAADQYEILVDGGASQVSVGRL